MFIIINCINSYSFTLIHDWKPTYPLSYCIFVSIQCYHYYKIIENHKELNQYGCNDHHEHQDMNNLHFQLDWDGLKKNPTGQEWTLSVFVWKSNELNILVNQWDLATQNEWLPSKCSISRDDWSRQKLSADRNFADQMQKP